MKITVSHKWMRVKFHGCTEDYIQNVCHGRCCDNSGARVTGTPVSEAEGKVLLGFPNVRIDNGLLRPIEGKQCPFHQSDGFCSVHKSGEKPLGCHISPFVVKKGKLGLRYRFVCLKCHLDFKDTGDPAYRAFAGPLARMFGETEAARITALLDDGIDHDFEADMPDDIYAYHMRHEAAIEDEKHRVS